jgi:hypothetical protein
MSLTDEDVQAIGKLLDQRLASQALVLQQRIDEIERRQRNRRRFWFWFWTINIVLSLVSGYWFYLKVAGYMNGYMNQVAAEEEDFRKAKVAYQRQLAHDQQMQRERAEAAKASGYTSDQPQADYEANLLRQVFALTGKVATMQKQANDPNASDDPDVLLKQMEDLSANMQQALGLTTQILLRNTDPEHNDRTDRLSAGGDAPAPAASPGSHGDPRVDDGLQKLQQQDAPKPAPASP